MSMQEGFSACCMKFALLLFHKRDALQCVDTTMLHLSNAYEVQNYLSWYSKCRLNRPDIFTYTGTFWICAPDGWQARCIEFRALQLCGMALKEVCYNWQKGRQLCVLCQKHSKEVSKVRRNSAAIQTPNIYRTHYKRRAPASHGTWLNLFCPSCCTFSTLLQALPTSTAYIAA